MRNPEISNNEDLLGIYGHVISLSYSINSGSFDNSTIGLTGEWGNGKTKIMSLTKDLIKEKYNGKYLIIDINPWEYNEDVDFFDILLKEFGKKITLMEKILKYIDYGKILKIIFIIILLLIIPIGWILYVILYINYNLFFLGQSLNSMLEIGKNISFFISPLLIYLSYIYIKSDFSFLNQYLLIGEKKERFKTIIDTKLNNKNLFSKKTNQKALFFIDDLDRCFSKQVVNILKTIVLFGNQKNSIFILGYDRKIIVENLKKELNFGYNEDDNKKVLSYLEKIINLEVSIPQIDKNDVSNYIDGNFNDKSSFNIKNLELPLKFLKEKENWINEQFIKNEFKKDLFDLINSKTPRGINTAYRTVYYNFIYLIVLQSYGYINFEPDINLLLKASILKQNFGKKFDEIVLSYDSKKVYDVIQKREELNKNINFLRIEKNKLEKINLYQFDFSYNKILKILKDVYFIKNNEESNIKNNEESNFEEIIKEINDNFNKIKEALNKAIKDINRDSSEKLLKYKKLIEDFENTFNSYKEIKENIDESYLRFVEKNQKGLIKIFSFEEIELDNFINYYYNPPKINNGLLIDFININNNFENIKYNDFKKLLLKYIILELKEKKDYEESQKIMFFLAKNLILKEEKVNNLYKIKKYFNDMIKEDKIFFGNFIEKLISDLENYFEKNKKIFSIVNEKRKYSSFENIKIVIIAISRLLNLSDTENINISLFENNFMKKYFEIILKLNLKHRIKEIGNIMILEKFNPGLFKYYDTINKALNNGKGNKFLNNFFIKNKKKLSEKKIEILKNIKN